MYNFPFYFHWNSFYLKLPISQTPTISEYFCGTIYVEISLVPDELRHWNIESCLCVALVTVGHLWISKYGSVKPKVSACHMQNVVILDASYKQAVDRNITSPTCCLLSFMTKSFQKGATQKTIIFFSRVELCRADRRKSKWQSCVSVKFTRVCVCVFQFS